MRSADSYRSVSLRGRKREDEIYHDLVILVIDILLLFVDILLFVIDRSLPIVDTLLQCGLAQTLDVVEMNSDAPT